MINVPTEAWVTESNILFVPTVGFMLSGFWLKAEMSANKIIEEWDYPVRVTTDTLLHHRSRKSVWVNPEYLECETWPDSEYGSTYKPGWVELLSYDLEDFDETE